MISVSVSVTNLWPCAVELALQLEIVFDDAVVDHDDAPGAVAVRVGVLFRGPAMRGPARVANAEGAVERMLAQNLFQIRELARRAPQTQACALPGLPTAMPAES